MQLHTADHKSGRLFFMMAPLLAAVLAMISATAFAADVVSTWNGAQANWASNNWINVPNVPHFPNNGNGGFTYDAVIGSGTVSLDQNITIQDLLLSGGIIGGDSNLNVLGDLAWTGGQFAGLGVTTVNGGSISGGTKLLQSRTLSIADDLNWSAGHILRPLSAGPRGTILVENGATFTATGSSKELDANVQVDSGGRFLNTAVSTLVAHVEFHDPGGMLINNGIVETAANTHLSIPGGSGNGAFVVGENAVMTVLLDDVSEFNFSGNIILNNGFFDAFTLDGSAVEFLLPSLIAGSGHIGIGTLINNREISPGNAAGENIGSLQLNGDYEQTSLGVLSMDVEGTGPAELDRFNVTGSATLGGTLRIDSTNLTTSTAGTEFEILDAGTLAGTFDYVDSVGNNNVYFLENYDYVTGMVSVEQLNRGDMNGDGPITMLDFELFAFGLMNASVTKFFEKCDCDVFPQQGGDFSGNGRLDFDDIAGFQSQLDGLGLAAEGLTAALESYFQQVPEPSTALLAFVSAVLGALLCPRLPIHRRYR